MFAGTVMWFVNCISLSVLLKGSGHGVHTVAVEEIVVVSAAVAVSVVLFLDPWEPLELDPFDYSLLALIDLTLRDLHIPQTR